MFTNFGRGAVIVMAVGIFSCSSSSSPSEPTTAADGTPLAAGFEPGPQPPNSLQIATPVLPQRPAGEDIEYCYYSNVIFDKPTSFSAGQGFQTPGGHHAVAYWTSQPQPVGQFNQCTENDMIAGHVLTGDGGESGNGVINDLPVGGAFQVPQGAQVMINMHVLNATGKAQDEQAVINLFYGDPNATALSSFYVTGTTFSIPPRATMTWSASCVAPQQFQVVRLLGHMHQYGTRSQVAITPAGSTTPNVVYDKPGAEDFSYNPPHIDFTLAAPMIINAGDTVASTCTWQNTTDDAIAFPTEMCAAFGYIIGDKPEQGCADGQWSTSQ